MIKNREEAYGNIYYINHRGKSDIFKDATDKLKLLECIGGAKEKYDFLLLGYCIMDNHYHLVLKTHNIAISKIMQSIHTRFGKYYSKHHNDLPFKGRYGSIIIKEEEIPEVINIIHNKPMDEGAVDVMEAYPYISDAFYRMNVDSIVDINYLLDILSPDRMTAIEEYTKLMHATPKDYEELTSRKDLKDLDRMLRGICPNEMDYNLIKKGSKKAYLMEYKKAFIDQARGLGYRTKEIGQSMNISDRAVRKHMDH